MMFEVVQYNLLSSDLCSPDFHIGCQAQYLDPTVRLDRICQKLTFNIRNCAIICLQELSPEWSLQLQEFFERHHYILITAGYETGIASLSCAIAYPKIYRQSNTLFMLPAMVIAEINPQLPFQPNVAIITTLTNSQNDHSLFIAVYHMPCQFHNPDIMAWHAQAVMYQVQQYAHTSEMRQPNGEIVPLIFAGDFNIRPHTPLYNKIITGSDEFFTTKPMFSAYRYVHGVEPAKTVMSATAYCPEVFADTLDYIFFDDPSLILPVSANVDEITSCIPNAYQPSDHVLLSVAFKFQ